MSATGLPVLPSVATHRVRTGLGPCPIPIVHKRLHGDIAPIVIVVTAAGAAIFLVADFVADMRHTLRHRREPGEQLFPPFSAEIDMAGLWTPGANLTRQFDLDRYFL